MALGGETRRGVIPRRDTSVRRIGIEEANGGIRVSGNPNDVVDADNGLGVEQGMPPNQCDQEAGRRRGSNPP